MKLFSLTLISLLAISISSCHKSDDVTFTVALTHTFHVDQVAAGDDIVYQVQDILDAASADPEFGKHRNSIKSVSVSSVTYTIQNVSTPGILFKSGTLAYSNVLMTEPDPSMGVATVGVEDVKAGENQEKILSFSQVAINDMSNWLKTTKQLNVYLNGTLSTSPAKFDVVMTINATVKAGA